MCAENEIVLSAGAFGSPQILLLSGVGPKSELEKFHIPIIAELPVGKNLQNHNNFWMSFYTHSSKGVSIFPFSNIIHWYNYLMHGTGSLAANSLSTSGFIKTNIAKVNNETRPDIQIYGIPIGMSNGNGLILGDPFNLNSTLIQQWVDFLEEY